MEISQAELRRTYSLWEEIISDAGEVITSKEIFGFNPLMDAHIIACPHELDNIIKIISEVKGLEIHQGFLGSCANAMVLIREY